MGRGPGDGPGPRFGQGAGRGPAGLPIFRALDRDGYSVFGEYRLGENRDWSLIGRYDRFNPDTDAAASDETGRWIGGLAWQFAPGNYWLLDYQRVEHDHPQIPDEHRVQLTLQVKY